MCKCIDPEVETEVEKKNFQLSFPTIIDPSSKRRCIIILGKAEIFQGYPVLKCTLLAENNTIGEVVLSQQEFNDAQAKRIYFAEIDIPEEKLPDEGNA